ncbi:betaine--homocysteine S-methyltransferase 1-like isoform X1 [Mizuhopecten yessoensis]|uniref:Betaine--homocysteine S-methyltransferase 1 n=1 Tax=Mizuhopecten yessoensis TaxID=6573 RepID=A0A210Q774_MIZYE|nr:betaine--homocysteine S-methyltransferase 1-like isoform X1 [Mizuhopecten yessoensis]OWF44592.1 Betaine--homocysteine S-methyltransferase 1 [Mizuhopecten yessoensis]
MPTKGLTERLADGESLVVAEGYLYEFERRGYLKAGAFVPEVVLEHPEQLRLLSEEFVHAGSDTVVAYTYYGHREKLRAIGREDDLEKLQRTALQIAREVADKTGTLMAGDICNTTVYDKDDPETHRDVTAMFKEQVEWAMEYNVDYIIGETFNDFGEALLALEAIKTYGKGVPAVITFAPSSAYSTFDGYLYGDACRKLEEAGAAVVGVNCNRGPKSMLPIVRDIIKSCKGPVACLPNPYRTTDEHPTMHSLKDADTGKMAFPDDLPAWLCSRTQIRAFANEAKEMGVRYIGLCCGNASYYTRIVAEVYGRTPPASKYSSDMSQHFVYGDEKFAKKYFSAGLKAKLATNE